MKRFGLCLMLIMAFAATAARAQTVGQSTVAPGGAVTMQAFYRVPPGQREAFLSLYKQYHLPVMQRFVDQGILKSIHIYQRRFRSQSPAWDYEVVLVWRDWAAIEEGHKTEPGIITAMYPNQQEYMAADKKRFELSSDVWIDILEEVDTAAK